MTIQIGHRVRVNDILTNSRNPIEYEFRLENQKGEIIQVLGDGYCLVEFNQFKIKMPVKKNSSKVYRFTNLMWYVHESDLWVIGGFESHGEALEMQNQERK